MGGGDLNLKKSWHPSTMRNMEKVWQAEQRHEAEQKRIAELQKELREEREREEVRKYAEDQGVVEKKDRTKLDWMYQGPAGAVDREEYLLGRAVDKTLETQLQAERNAGVTSNSRMHPEYDGMPTPLLKEIAGSSNEQVDMVRKMQEDPLSAIRKKEIETKTQLLSNPVKLKQLQQLLQEQKKKDNWGSSKHKNEKKHKKKKKKRHQRNDSSDEEGAGYLDRMLAAKYSQLRKRMEKAELQQVLAPDSNSSSSSEDETLKTSHKTQHKRPTLSNSSDNSKRKKQYGLVLPTGTVSKAQGKVNASRKRSRSKSPPKKQDIKIPEKQERKNSKRLTEEEKALRLQEMQVNASWREEERSKNVKRYRDEDRKEKEHHKDHFDKKFITKQLSKAASQGTVEGRIRSNLNYIQRSGTAMDTNFVRR